MKVKYLNRQVLTLILVSLAIAPSFALGEGNRNLFLISLMSISPLYLFFASKKMYNHEVVLLTFLFSIILFPLLNQPASMRWSTVLYTGMFGFTFMAYSRLLYKGSFKKEDYLNVLKNLIYAYFIVLLIQQICVVTGLPIFNMSNYNPGEPWKLNSLSAEPSHSARIIALLMFCFISIQEIIINRRYNLKKDFKSDKIIWIAFLYSMVTMGSSTAILFIGVLLLKFLRPKNLLPLSLILLLLLYIINITGASSLGRTYGTILATLTFDEQAIIEADHSASIRIVPMIILGKMVGFGDQNDWFGHGIDHVGSFLSTKLPGINEGTSGGGLLQLWIEYGFISFILFIIFSLSNSFRKGDFISLVFWFLLVFLYGVNNQMVWLCIILLFTNKYFSDMVYNKRKYLNTPIFYNL